MNLNQIKLPNPLRLKLFPFNSKYEEAKKRIEVLENMLEQQMMYKAALVESHTQMMSASQTHS